MIIHVLKTKSVKTIMISNRVNMSLPHVIWASFGLPFEKKSLDSNHVIWRFFGFRPSSSLL